MTGAGSVISVHHKQTSAREGPGRLDNVHLHSLSLSMSVCGIHDSHCHPHSLPWHCYASTLLPSWWTKSLQPLQQHRTMHVALHAFCFQWASTLTQDCAQSQSCCCFFKIHPGLVQSTGYTSPAKVFYHISWHTAECINTGHCHTPAISDGCPIVLPYELSDLQEPGATQHPFPSCAPWKASMHVTKQNDIWQAHSRKWLFASLTHWLRRLQMTLIYRMHSIFEASCDTWSHGHVIFFRL